MPERSPGLTSVAEANEFPKQRKVVDALSQYGADEQHQFRVAKTAMKGGVIQFAPRPLDQYHVGTPSGGSQETLTGIIKSGGVAYGVVAGARVDVKPGGLREGLDVKSGLLLTSLPETLEQRAQGKVIGKIGEQGLANHNFEIREMQGNVFIANTSGEELEVISQAEFVADLSDTDRFGFETGYSRPDEANTPTMLAVSGAWFVPSEQIREALE